jgi:hypothetical protein
LGLLAVIATQRPMLAQSHGRAAHDLNDHGTFEIYSGGKIIGTDTFEIRTHADRLEALGNGHLSVEQNGKTIEVETTSNLVLDDQLNPITYTWTQQGPQSSRLSVDFRSQPAHVRYKQVDGKEDKQDMKLDPDVVVLDDNEIQHYQLALDRFAASNGGPLLLSGFTPQEAQPGVIILNDMGNEQVDFNGQRAALRHFTLAVASTLINLWADDQGHLQLVSAANQQFQAVRKKEDSK